MRRCDTRSWQGRHHHLDNRAVGLSSTAALLPSAQRLKSGWLRKTQGVFYSQTLLPSLDHFIRSRQHVRRDRQVDLLRGFKIDDEFKLYWLFDGKIRRFRAF